jgi:hypothetical protein
MLTFKSATAFSASATVPILTRFHCKISVKFWQRAVADMRQLQRDHTDEAEELLSNRSAAATASRCFVDICNSMTMSSFSKAHTVTLNS